MHLCASNPEHKVWLEISILIHPVAREALCAFLFDLGCAGVISEDFRERTIKAYLPFQENMEDIRNRIDIFLLTANLILGEILDLLPALPHHLNPGGWLIISGILREQVKEVESALQAFSFHDHDILYREEWACIITRAFMKGSGP